MSEASSRGAEASSRGAEASSSGSGASDGREASSNGRAAFDARGATDSCNAIDGDAAFSVALFTARALVDELVRGGVGRVFVAPGSRSTALALAVAERPELAATIQTDERSLAFFALGVARATSETVALVCTSGTAAANFLPAVVEASLGGAAMVLLTADRPPELRDCAAPQTIDQAGLFGSHVRWSTDVPILDVRPGTASAAPSESAVAAARVLRSIAARAVATAAAGRGGPVQLNVPLREPFIDDSFPATTAFAVAARPQGRPFTTVTSSTRAATADIDALAARLSAASRGVVVASGPELDGREVAALAAALGWPILADPMSGLRYGPHDRSQVVCAAEPVLRDDALRGALAPDCVLRFGLVPAPRSVQRLLDDAWPADEIVVAPEGWPDPMRAASTIVREDPASLCAALAARVGSSVDPAWLPAWRRTSDAARASLDACTDETLFDGLVLRALARELPEGSTVVVGNSMPVRDADTFVGSSPRRLRVIASRGASGIDGVLSTALGVASASAGPTALVVGDLSFLHDAAALVAAARDRIPLLVVVVNNDGGGIFSYLPLHGRLEARDGDVFERYFGTPHGADLSRVVPDAAAYRLVTSAAGLAPALRDGLADAARGPVVVEVRTDREAGRRAQLAIVAAAQEAARHALDGAVGGSEAKRRTA